MTSEREGPGAERRRWLSVILATVVLLLAYFMFIFALSALATGENVFAGGILGISFGLVPGVFIVAAFVSRNPRTARSTLKATGLWFVVAIPLMFLDLPTALVAGFGAGGIVAFRLEEEHSVKARVVAVSACAVYTFALTRVSPALGLFGASLLPFLAIALADVYSERNAEEAAD